MSYKRGQLPALIDIEKIIYGSDYGANSWTTRLEAEETCRSLGLRYGDRLLDIGSGTGWPGLYIAKRSGCEVILIDLPRSALEVAVDRSISDQLDQRVWACVGDAASLPFKKGMFDAINHSDILCCLSRKYDTLLACREVLRPEGRMAFSVVALSPNLSIEGTARAIANGPEFVETAVGYIELLEQTGWKILEYRDVTQECAKLCQQLAQIDQAKREELIQAIGEDGYEERQTDWQSRLDAIEEGLLQREYFLVTPLR